MFKFERTMRKGKKPDMTPLIDIIFQLILFFMLTTTFVKVEAIDIFVSSSKPSLPHNPSVAMPITLDLKNDGIYMGGKKVPALRLTEILSKELAMDTTRPVKLVAQKGVNVQKLVNAIDIARNAGGTNITLDSHEAMASMNPEDGPPQPIPLPDLQSTKGNEGNAGNFNFDNPQGWMQR